MKPILVTMTTASGAAGPFVGSPGFRISLRDIVPVDPGVLDPAQDGHAGELSTGVWDNGSRQTTRGEDMKQTLSVGEATT